ncbi:hypothetical protein RvY_12047 [Ramazzottius varieornatus]|uniref:Transcription elongation regulator 1 n=1 Tax=Ramazzottius varieornatus TaxID=947166 RepID=A0A1D1VMF2_RAMVA|nr:hypothetical protein RvY_12047 [Ramazzottius varieornatus]
MAAPFTAVPPPQVIPAAQPEVWMEAKAPDGKVYYYHAVTRATAWTLPPGAQLMKPPGATVTAGGDAGGQAGAAQNAMGQAQAASQYQLGAPSSINQGAVPTLSMSQQPHPVPMQQQQPMPMPMQMPMPGMMPMQGPHGMPMPGMMPPAMFGVPPGMGFPPFSPFMPPPGMMPPIVARSDPADWTEYPNGSGASSWYNSKLGKTVFEKPPEVAEYEQRKKLEANASAKTDSKAGEAKKDAATKPVATKQIPGTPWCVVWTSDKKSFFHNPSTKASVWKKPAELVGMQEVDDILAQVPEEVAVALKEEIKTEPAENGQNGAGGTSGVKREGNDAVEGNTAKRLKMEVEDGASRSSVESDGEGSQSSRTKENNTTPNAKAASQRFAAQPKAKTDPAMEAELKAAKERESIPLSERTKRFKELLAERDVSAFSTWEKELHKIVFDSRYLLLTSKDRRDVFDEYTRERAEQEREEKKKKMVEIKEAFKNLLNEANLTSKSSFTDFSAKYGKDERYRNIERMKDREQLFDDFTHELKRREREKRIAEQEKIKDNFMEMLSEVPGINRKSHWSDIKKKLRDDPRYERVESSNQREEIFRDFVKTLPKKREKEEKEEDGNEEEKSKGVDGDEDEEEKEDKDVEDDKGKEEREKQERMEASMRERQRQVQEELSVVAKDRDKEREHHRFDEAVQHYKALLVDLVRTTELTYKEARKILKKDSRYDLAEPLGKHQKEEIYEEHLDMLSAKKKQAYRDLLDEIDVALDASWKETKKKIRDDPRYAKFSSSESKCEKEFHKYLRDKTDKAKLDFRDLLKETKMLDFKSKAKAEESDQVMRDLIEILKMDKRYSTLEPLSKDRKNILLEYMDELARRGPPPPPTASEPSRRGK